MHNCTIGQVHWSRTRSIVSSISPREGLKVVCDAARSWLVQARCPIHLHDNKLKQRIRDMIHKSRFEILFEPPDKMMIVLDDRCGLKADAVL